MYDEIKTNDMAKPTQLKSHITYRLQKPNDNNNYMSTTPNKI